MANVVRVRVELKKKYNDPMKNFNEMKNEFKRRCGHAGILHDYKDHQSFESRSQKDRRKRFKAKRKFEMEALTQKILAGERVKAPAGLIKKILENNRKERKYDDGE